MSIPSQDWKKITGSGKVDSFWDISGLVFVPFMCDRGTPSFLTTINNPNETSEQTKNLDLVNIGVYVICPWIKAKIGPSTILAKLTEKTGS